MPGPDDDISLEEKRVYAAKAGRTDVFVASRMGLVRVAVSADKIGEFTLSWRGAVADVVTIPTESVVGQPDDDLLAVATDEDVMIGVADADPGLEGTGFGPAVAVGRDDGGLIAAAPDGTVGRLDDLSGHGSWTELGTADEVRAISGTLLATASGVSRIVDGELTHAGLDDVNDVAGHGVPLAATATGLYWLGNGWMNAIDGLFQAVASDGRDHATAAPAEPGVVLDHEGDEWDESTWSQTALPVEEAVVSLAYGPGMAVAVTDAGTLCVDVGDGWRHQVLGVRDVGGIAVADRTVE